METLTAMILVFIIIIWNPEYRTLIYDIIPQSPDGLAPPNPLTSGEGAAVCKESSPPVASRQSAKSNSHVASWQYAKNLVCSQQSPVCKRLPYIPMAKNSKRN
jgi:hypothetical protein